MPVSIFATRDGELDAADRFAFDALVQRLANKRSNVFLHLHGGLVNEQSGRGVANRLAGAAPNGFGFGDDWEQIYIVWRTGPVETLKANWEDLFSNDRLYRVALRKVLEFVARKLKVAGDPGGRSAFDAVNLTSDEILRRLDNPPDGDPFSDVTQLTQAGKDGRSVLVTDESEADLARDFSLKLREDREFTSVADDIAAAQVIDRDTSRSLSATGDASAGQHSLENLDPAIQSELQAQVPDDRPGREVFTGAKIAKFLIKHAVAIAIRVIRRHRQGRHHGFYPTTVEELAREMYGAKIGSAIWGMMKKDAADHFINSGYGTALLSVFINSPPSRLAISGHSAGSIWATEMIKALKSQPNAPTIRIAFMAPAVRMDLFANAIQGADAVVGDFRMFTMSDELECKDCVLGAGKGFIYPRSLLYLVSGICEENDRDAFPDAPLLGMARFLKGEPETWKDPAQIDAARKCIEFVSAPGHEVVYSPTNSPGRSTAATSHGGFDNDAATLASVAAFFSTQ